MKLSMHNMVSSLKSVHNNLPIGIIATCVGATTLSNIFALHELIYLKDVFMNLAAFVALLGVLKVIIYKDKVKEELNLPVVASVFPTFGMLTMILGNYYLKFSYILGKGMWTIGLTIYLVLSVIAVYKHIIKKFNFNTFVPSFFIPFVGILVACVSSTGMNEPILTKYIFYWGTITYFILLPIMIYRIYKGHIDTIIFPTVVIMAAPPSLVVVSYLTIFDTFNKGFITFMISLVLIMTLFAYTRIPICLKEDFNVGFASLTFPLAISTLATFKTSMYFENINITFSHFLQLAGVIELFIATSIIGFVLYNLFILLFRKLSAQDAME